MAMTGVHHAAPSWRGRLRREIFAKICEDIARVQFQVDR